MHPDPTAQNPPTDPPSAAPEPYATWDPSQATDEPDGLPDRAIVPLVESLRSRGIVTLQSCAGHPGTDDGCLWVRADTLDGAQLRLFLLPEQQRQEVFHRVQFVHWPEQRWEFIWPPERTEAAMAALDGLLPVVPTEEPIQGGGTAGAPEPKTAAHGAGSGFPHVAGRCPACRGASLFLGEGGHVTCSRLDCPNPILADDLLDESPAVVQVVAAAREWRATRHDLGRPRRMPPAEIERSVARIDLAEGVLAAAVEAAEAAQSVDDHQERLEQDLADAEAREDQAEWARTAPTGDDPIPRYAQLDVWMELGGDSAVFEQWRDGRSFADAWAQLTAAVRGDAGTLRKDRNPPAGALLELLERQEAESDRRREWVAALRWSADQAREAAERYEAQGNLREADASRYAAACLEVDAQRIESGVLTPWGEAAPERCTALTRHTDINGDDMVPCDNPLPCPWHPGETPEQSAAIVDAETTREPGCTPGWCYDPRCEECRAGRAEPAPEPAGDGPGWDRERLQMFIDGKIHGGPEEERQVAALLADRDQLKADLSLERDLRAIVDRDATRQIATLAEWIATHVPGEPSRSEGAAECAIRLLGQLDPDAYNEMAADLARTEQERHAARAELERLRELTADSIDPATIPEQQAKNWADWHPEAYCHRCGRPNISWYADSAIWNEVHGGSGPIWCPVCFAAAYEQTTGRRISWRLAPADKSDEVGHLIQSEAIMRHERDAARAEATELQQLFTLQQTRMTEAVARWRSEAPAERQNILPDLGALLKWLLDREHEATQLRYERRLLGATRTLLDRIARYDQVEDPRWLDQFGADLIQAGEMAQRIVDEIGHPVTDEPALGPSFRAQLADATAELDRLHGVAERAMAERREIAQDRNDAQDKVEAFPDRLATARRDAAATTLTELADRMRRAGLDSIRPDQLDQRAAEVRTGQRDVPSRNGGDA